jgi:FtsH-binding integral membrane protein
MMIILSVLLIAVSCFMGCAMTAFRRLAPVIFVIFTILMALLLGISICNYKSKIILMAAGITFLLVAALTAYACNFLSY